MVVRREKNELRVLCPCFFSGLCIVTPALFSSTCEMYTTFHDVILGQVKLVHSWWFHWYWIERNRTESGNECKWTSVKPRSFFVP